MEKALALAGKPESANEAYEYSIKHNPKNKGEIDMLKKIKAAQLEALY